MSDTGRESFTDKASRNLKPQNEKGCMESVTDTMKDKGDEFMSAMQPDSKKSHTQRAGDAMSGNDTRSPDCGDESLFDKAKNTIGMGNKGK